MSTISPTLQNESVRSNVQTFEIGVLVWSEVGRKSNGALLLEASREGILRRVSALLLVPQCDMEQSYPSTGSETGGVTHLDDVGLFAVLRCGGCDFKSTSNSAQSGVVLWALALKATLS